MDLVNDTVCFRALNRCQPPFDFLGDTHIPFAKLGKQLKLPQTATLSLRAPEQYVARRAIFCHSRSLISIRIPFLYEQAFQWYTSFDPLGELIERPNPTPALDLLTKVIGHLVQDCRWPPQRIHFFGFAQGGTVAAEFGMTWWKSECAKRTQPCGRPPPLPGGGNPEHDVCGGHLPHPHTAHPG